MKILITTVAIIALLVRTWMDTGSLALATVLGILSFFFLANTIAIGKILSLLDGAQSVSMDAKEFKKFMENLDND